MKGKPFTIVGPQGNFRVNIWTLPIIKQNYKLMLISMISLSAITRKNLPRLNFMRLLFETVLFIILKYAKP